MSCLTEYSRSRVPIWPRKYLETTTLVASCDQALGISTPFCSKTTVPSLPTMLAVRSSHSVVFQTSWPGWV